MRVFGDDTVGDVLHSDARQHIDARRVGSRGRRVDFDADRVGVYLPRRQTAAATYGLRRIVGRRTPGDVPRRLPRRHLAGECCAVLSAPVHM